MFEQFGVTTLEEEVYRTLLESPRLSRSEIARKIGASLSEVSDALEGLDRRGLASRGPGRGARPIPLPPTDAADVLIRRYQEDMEGIRDRARELEEELQLAARQRYPLDLIEIVRGNEGVVERWKQLQQAAQEEVLEFERPPYANPGLNEDELQMLRRGVRYRKLYDHESLEFEGNLDLIRLYLSEGEEARVVPVLPMKLAVGDRSIALVPLTTTDPGSGACAVIHSSPLLEAVRQLFEMTWERAIPLQWPTSSEVPTRSEKGISEEDRRLLLLLAGGLKDEAIARRLGIGVRTLYRRLDRLMVALGAETRFQAGLQAARQGLL
jgi:sugar-specific transcriptional regulator TrmB/DNA-binding CsgD family transcriptional regulator